MTLSLRGITHSNFLGRSQYICALDLLDWAICPHGSGLGFGLASVMVRSGSTLERSLGPGTSYSLTCPALSVYLAAALHSCLIVAFNVFLMVKIVVRSGRDAALSLRWLERVRKSQQRDTTWQQPSAHHLHASL